MYLLRKSRLHYVGAKFALTATETAVFEQDLPEVDIRITHWRANKDYLSVGHSRVIDAAPTQAMPPVEIGEAHSVIVPPSPQYDGPQENKEHLIFGKSRVTDAPSTTKASMPIEIAEVPSVIVPTITQYDGPQENLTVGKSRVTDALSTTKASLPIEIGEVPSVIVPPSPQSDGPQENLMVGKSRVVDAPSKTQMMLPVEIGEAHSETVTTSSQYDGAAENKARSVVKDTSNGVQEIPIKDVAKPSSENLHQVLCKQESDQSIHPAI